MVIPVYTLFSTASFFFAAHFSSTAHFFVPPLTFFPLLTFFPPLTFFPVKNNIRDDWSLRQLKNEDTEDEIRKVKKCIKQKIAASNVLLVQVYLRSGNSQRLVAVVIPVYTLFSTASFFFRCSLFFHRSLFCSTAHFFSPAHFFSAAHFFSTEK